MVCARQYISGKENILYICKVENLHFFIAKLSTLFAHISQSPDSDKTVVEFRGRIICCPLPKREYYERNDGAQVMQGRYCQKFQLNNESGW